MTESLTCEDVKTGNLAYSQVKAVVTHGLSCIFLSFSFRFCFTVGGLLTAFTSKGNKSNGTNLASNAYSTLVYRVEGML